MSQQPPPNDLAEVKEKVNAILKVLQDFGLNVIQNLGQLKRTLTMNTSQVEELSKAVIEVKEMGKRLSEVLKMKEEMTAEITDLKFLVKALNLKIQGTRVPVESSSPGAPLSLASATTPKDVMQYLLDTIAREPRGDGLFDEFQRAKEELYKMIGGNRILREIGEAARNLKGKAEITDSEKEELRVKIQEWTRVL